jgi:hypothetical protein
MKKRLNLSLAIKNHLSQRKIKGHQPNQILSDQNKVGTYVTSLKIIFAVSVEQQAVSKHMER